MDIEKQHECRNKNAVALLNYAVGFGSVKDVKHLIDLGADVNAKDDLGRSPLHYAAECNPNVEVAKYLVEHGANIRTKDGQGWTPLDVAIRYAKSEEVGLYFMEIMTGQKGREVTDPVELARIKQCFMQ